jgi:NDP-sugar pyrophosphorylase family protein
MSFSSKDLRAVILAGGRGTRLGPFTAVLPKPLVPLGDMPVLEILLRCLARFGVTRATLAVNHLASLLQAYFGDGRKFGIDIDYVIEDEPLGTAGPLAGIGGLDRAFLVVNGDLLTDLDFGALIEAHRQSGAAATIGLYRREVRLDFGIVEIDDKRWVVDYIEKPAPAHLISMGAYVMEPAVLKHIVRGERLDLPDLVRSLIRTDMRVSAYVHQGYWLDIGRPEDYGQAQEDFPKMRDLLLGS